MEGLARASGITMRLFFLAICSFVAAVSAQNCGRGWIQFGGQCYQIVSSTSIWENARVDCHSKGGDLVVIPDQETAVFLNMSLIGVWESHWIGLHSRNEELNFVWVDNFVNVTNFSMWAPGNPLTWDIFKDCVYLNPINGLWYNDLCWNPRPYICQRTLGVLPKCDVTNGWRSYNGKCYKIMERHKNWLGAEDSCASYPGGHLASVTSLADLTFITNIQATKQSTVWIGLSDMNRTIGDYEWSDGSSFSDTDANWDDGQPNNAYFDSGGDCVDVAPSGLWRVRSCTSSYKFFLCAVSEGTCAQGWHLLVDHCYQLNYNVKKTWTDAKHHCEAQDGYLMTIHGSFETALIQSFLPDLLDFDIDTLFIGISDQETNGSFQWVDESSVEYQLWAPSQPANTNHTDCGYIYTGDLAAEWMVGDCFVMGAYICEIKAGVPVEIVPPEIETGRCEPGWDLHGNFCYEFSSDKKSWDDANATCVAMDSHLASIHSDREQSFFSTRLDILKEDYWIGLNDKESRGTLVWTDGTPVDYLNWRAGPGFFHCVMMYGDGNNLGLWETQGWWLSKRYACKKEKINDGTVHTPSPPPTPVTELRCGIGWEYDASSSKCYAFRSYEYKTWHDARYRCRVEGGDLISISGFEDQQFIRSRLQSSSEGQSWIGCNDLARERGWEWSDGSPFAFFNWEPGQPDNGFGDSPLGEHCCNFINQVGSWNDDDCYNELGYSCKRSDYIFKYFITFTERRLPNHDDTSRYRYNVWPEECAQLCMDAIPSQCRSFDYQREQRTCYMSTDDAVSAGGLVTTYTGDHFDYYERDLTVSVPTKPPPLPSNYGCPPDWRGYDRHCYLVNATRRPYSEAESFCQDLGAELVSIKDRNTNNFLRGFANEVAPSENRFWIGLTDRTQEMLFEWSDGEPVTFTNWRSGQPNNRNGADCTKMAIRTGYWSDSAGRRSFGSICKKPMDISAPPPVDGSCPNGWISWRGSCYLADQTKASWANASTQCSASGGRLVVIEDSYELAFLSGLLGLQDEDNFFIGLSDSVIPGYYEWIDGSEVTFAHWAAGQPDDRTGHCVTMNSGRNAGYWTDRACSQPYRYICEKSRAGWPTPTLPPVNPPTQPSDVDCSPGWIGYGDYCFKPFEFNSSSDLVTWMYAHAECARLGARVVSFHHPNEEKHIMDSFTPTTGRGFWISLNDRRNEGGYEWTDGSVVQYTNWGPGQPNDLGGQQECVETFLTPLQGWNDVNCEELRNYICQIPKGTALRTTAAPTLPPGRPCVDDPTWVHRYPYCYYFSDSSDDDGVLDWHNAEMWCQSKNGNLVSIHDADEQRFLVRYSDIFTAYYWIGLRENGSRAGHYEWSDGSFLDYENWRRNQPDDNNGEEQCANMNKFLAPIPGRWSDNNCGLEQPFICKRQADDPPFGTPVPTDAPTGGCPSGWWKYNNRCYMIGGKTLESRKTWHDARTECQKTPGANLASIHDDRVQVILSAHLIFVDSDVWIGMSSLSSNNRFLWTDGSSFDYENWGYNQPDASSTGNATECVELMNEAQETGKWNDEDCSQRSSYICLMKPDPIYPDTPFIPPACPNKPDYIKYGDACFKLDNSTKRTLDEAKQYCANDGALLASILNGYEQALLQSLLNEYAEGNVRLGLYKDPETNTFTWLDGWPLYFTNWAWNSPNNAGECVVMAKNNFLYNDGEWATVTCIFKQYTACKYSEVTPPTPHPTSAGYCPSGWQDFGSSCYTVGSDIFTTKSFPEARYECQFNYGAELVTIASEAENQFVRQLAYDTFGLSELLLGMHRSANGGWEWVDGMPASYINWGSNAPPDGQQNCVEMHLDSQGKWFGLNCLERSHFMCEIPKTPYSSTALPPIHTSTATEGPVPVTGEPLRTSEVPHPTSENPITQPVPCTTGWISRAPYCYYIHRELSDWLTWTEADGFCNNNGGYLVSIHSREENNFIKSNLPMSMDTFWIGFRETVLGGNHTWSDNTDSSYDNWNSGEPNDHQGEEECAEMYRSSGKWNDMACGVPKPFICKKLASNTDPIPIPTPYPLSGGCQEGWYRMGYQCYGLFGDDQASSPGLSWRDARADCITKGGTLATVSGQDVQVLLTAQMDQLNGSNAWIGLNRLVNDFHWTDGSRLNFTHWAEGKPAVSGGCVYLVNDEERPGLWANVGGSTREGYFCQKPLDPKLPDTSMGVQCDTPNYFQFEEACYRVETTAMNYDDAELNCHADLGKLVSIDSSFQEALVESMLYFYDIKDSWIGLMRDSSGTFSWLNNDKLSYLNWDKDEPSSEDGEGCVRIIAGGRWDNTVCKSKRTSVCQIGGVSPVTPTRATARRCELAGWEQDGDQCFLFKTGLKQVSRKLAERECWDKYTATLPDIHSNEQNEFIRKNSKTALPSGTGSVWLQMFRNSEDDFAYNDTSGSKVDYVNWASGQPDGQLSGADCIVMNLDNGKWSDEDCVTKKADCICKLPASLDIGVPSDRPKPHTGVLSTGGIVGIVFGVIIAVNIVIVMGYYVTKRRRGKGNFDSQELTSSVGFENATYFSNVEMENKSEI